MSRLSRSGGNSPTRTTRWSASGANRSAATRSTGSTTSTPRFSASASTRGDLRDLVRFEQRLAHLVALRGQERVGHAADDDQPVRLAEQVADDRELVRRLGPAEHHHVRSRRVGGELAQHRDLGDDQVPGGVREQPRHVVHAGVLAVQRAEPVARHTAWPARPAGPPARPARRRPCWSRRARSARSPAAATSPSASPAAVAAADSPATSVANATGWPSSSPSRAATGRSDGPPAARAAYPSPFGRPRCAQTMHPRAAAGQLADHRQAGLDPAVVGDPLAVQRHVQVGAQQHRAARPPSRSSMRFIRAARRRAWSGRPAGWSSPTRCRTSR